MNQRIPEFDLISHDGPMVCDFCHEKVTFLVGISQTATNLDGNHCRDCFHKKKPEFTDAITDFSELLDLLVEIKSRSMSLDEMYELYGNDEPEPEEEEENTEE